MRPYKEFTRARVEQSQHEEDREGQGGEDADEAAHHQPGLGGAADAGLLVLGLAWLVVFYVAGQDIPVMDKLGNWNLLIGMGLIAVGFVVSTQWV